MSPGVAYLQPVPSIQGTVTKMLGEQIGGSTTRLPLEEKESRIVSTVNAQLALLPEPLKLIHGPLLATIETWSSGTVVARLPVPPIYGEGDTDTEALCDLADEALVYAESVIAMVNEGTELGGPALQFWQSFRAVVDVSALEHP